MNETASHLDERIPSQPASRVCWCPTIAGNPEQILQHMLSVGPTSIIGETSRAWLSVRSLRF